MGSQLGAFFSNNARYDYFYALSFGVNYNCVAQKLRILAINAIFDPKSLFLTNSIDDRIKIKAEITRFYMRYYVYRIKVAVVFATCNHQKCKLCAVAGVEGF